MNNNWVVAIGIICGALVLMTIFVCDAWIHSPQEFTFKIEMDNNTKEAFESINYSEINKQEEGCKFDAEYWWNDGNGITQQEINTTKFRKQISCFQKEIIEAEDIGFVLGSKR